MTQSKELKQVRDALCKHHAYQVQSGMADYVTSSILFLDTEKALATLDRISAAPTPEQTEIDLDKIKDEACEFIYHKIVDKEADHPEAVKLFIDHLAATGRLKV